MGGTVTAPWGQGAVVAVCLSVCSLWEAALGGAVCSQALLGLGSPDLFLQPQAPPQPVLLLPGCPGASSVNPLPLGLLGHEGGRGSSPKPCPGKRTLTLNSLSWQKNSAPKFSALAKGLCFKFSALTKRLCS